MCHVISRYNWLRKWAWRTTFKKKRNFSGAKGATRFLYDGDELVAEYNGAGGMLRRYVHGTGVDDPLAVFEGSGVADSAARLVKTNHQGSVVALTDWNGNLLSKNSYDDWGIPAATNASMAQGGRFAYTGQAWIPELGMYYYKGRIYSPTLGRFLQTDPIGYKDQINLYGYVGNDPVNMVDPAGMVGSLLEDFRQRMAEKKWNNDFNGLSASNQQALRSQIAERYGANSREANFAGVDHNGGPPINEPRPRPSAAQIVGRIVGVRGGPVAATTTLSSDTCRSCAIDGIESVMNNPEMLRDVTLDAFYGRVGTPKGWVWGPSASKGGWKLSELNARGSGYTGRQVRWHPGHPGGGRGPSKEGPYWRVNHGSGQAPEIPSGGDW